LRHNGFLSGGSNEAASQRRRTAIPEQARSHARLAREVRTCS
jgi:hypothetical protein